MEYRKLTEEDATAYWALRLEAVEREPRSFGPTPEEHRQITIDQIVALLCGQNSFVMGAFDGEAMIGALVDEVKKDASCEQLLLAVGVFNEPARKAYAAMGFVAFGVEPRALKVDGVYLDEEHMILRL